MPHVTGGEAVVRSLVALGVRAVFGIPGTHALALFDALLDAPEIKRITTRHEQGAAFMADGYARASGEVGVCLTSTGPGAINTLAAMGTAFADSSPVLNVFTQIPTADIGRGKGHLHEVRDQLGMFSQVTGWRERAENVAAIPWLVSEAMSQMRNGRPRPAALELPVDVLNATGDAPILPRTSCVWKVSDPEQVSAAAEALSRAKRPVIWAGGGVVTSGASVELVRLAEVLQAPVLSTTMGKGAMPDDHPLCLGSLARRKPVREYLAECDVVLVVGSRLDALDTDHWKLTLPQVIIQVDIDPAEIGRNYPVSVGVVGDAKEVLAHLGQIVGDTSGDRPSRVGEVADLKAHVRRDLVARSEETVQLIHDIRSVLPRDGIIVNDVTICAYWGIPLFPVYHPRTYLYPGGFITLGFGLPAAIGAKVACPDKMVLAICGDGGFLYTASELATAVQFGINVVALVVNDNRFGILEPQQKQQFGRTVMIELHNPDFASLARSFGAYGVSIDRVEEVGPALRQAFAQERPCVVELRTTLPHPFDW